MSATLLLLCLLQSQPQSQSQPQAHTAPVPLATWEPKDFEARWVAYHDALAVNPRAHEQWLPWLASRQEFDLLALIALCDRNLGAIGYLAEAGAPQWIRVAAWLTHQGDSHTADAVRKLLLEKDPPRVLGWLQTHRDQVLPNARSIEGMLLKANNRPAPRAGDLPPYRAEHVFALLATPVTQDLPEFGRRERAEPDVRYLHQVLRTIQAFCHSSVRDEPWLGQLLKLTRHRDARVRRAACLAFSHVPSEQIPYREFLAVARSPAEDEDRRAALMAASFATVPEVWLLLHQLAKDPLDPTWPVAVSRLGDVGNGFTVAWLEALPLELGQRTEIQSTLQMVRCREASRNPVELPLHAETCLRRAAWAETSKHPLAPRLAEWTLTQLREWQTTPAVANHLQSLAEDPQLRDLLRRAAR